MGEQLDGGFYQGQPHGSLAQRLLANGMNPKALRSNAALQYDEWKALDDAVRKVATRRMPLTRALISRGLTVDLPDAMGSTVYQYQDVSDMQPAELSMSIRSVSTEDAVDFGTKYLPIPIAHKGFRIDGRVLAASQKSGMPLDTTMAETATRLVAEKIEASHLTASAPTFGGGTLYGVTTHTSANAVTLSANWDASAKTGNLILDDVLSMIQACINDRHYGPYLLCIPTAYQTVLSNDFKANSDSSIRERLMEIDVLEDIIVCDFMTANTCALFELSAETARIIDGIQPTLIEWEEPGTMDHHFRVIAIMVGQFRADYAGRMGVAVLS